MSRAYREMSMSSDDAMGLQKLVETAPSAQRIVALVETQQRMSQEASRRGLVRTLANGIELGIKSRGLGREQVDFLRGLLQKYGVETVTECIEREKQLRHSVNGQLHEMINLQEGAERYRGHYDEAIRALDAFGIDHREAPTWEEIGKRLTPKKLALIEKLKGARLIIVSPLSRQDLLKALNSKVGNSGMKYQALVHQLENDQLWSNGKAEKDLEWEIMFVDGCQDVPYNNNLQSGKTPCEQMNALRALHEKAGFSTLVGARAYLTLMMQGLVAGKPTDKDFWTVVNVNVVADGKNVHLSFGFWSDGQVVLYDVIPVSQFNALRLRAVVRV